MIRTGRCRSASAVPRPTTPRGRLRVLEPHQPGLAQRVDRDDPGAVPLGRLQRGEHPRVVGAGVLAGDHDQLGLVEVVERAPCPCRCRSSRPAPTRSTRGTCSSSRAGCSCRRPGRTAGRRTPPRWRSGRRCRRPPRPGEASPLRCSAISANASSQRDRLVVARPGPQHHRLGEPALLAQPVVGPVRRARPSGARRRTPGRCGGGSPPRRPPWRRSRRTPRCAGAPASGSGQAQPGQSKPSIWLSRSSVVRVRRDAHLLDGALHRDRDRLRAGRASCGAVDLEVVLVDVADRRLAAHAAILPAPPAHAPVDTPGRMARPGPVQRPHERLGSGRSHVLGARRLARRPRPMKEHA